MRIDGVNYKKMRGVFIEVPEPDMVLPTYNNKIVNVRGRLVGKVVKNTTVSPGSMSLVFTGAFESVKNKRDFETLLNNTFNNPESKGVHELILPTDEDVVYLVVLSDNIKATTPTDQVILYNSGDFRIIKKYEVPLDILQVKKKVTVKQGSKSAIFSGLSTSRRYVVEVELTVENVDLLMRRKKYKQTFNNKDVVIEMYNIVNNNQKITIDPFIQCLRDESGIVGDLNKPIPIIHNSRDVVVDLDDWGYRGGNVYTLWEVI